MKKFLLLFSAVLFGFANAFAQEEWADPQSHDDVVTDISQLSNNKVYSIIPEDWYHPTQDGEYLRPNSGKSHPERLLRPAAAVCHHQL